MSPQDEWKDRLGPGEVIVWTADPTTLKLQSITENARELLDCPAERALEVGFWAARIHAEDRERFLSTAHSAIAAGSGYRLVYRFIAAHGKVVWLMDVVRLVRNPLDERTQLRGLTIDVTDCGDPDEVRTQQAILRQMSDNIQEIFWMLDTATGNAIFVNPAFEKITGYSRESLLASPLSYRNIIHPEDQEWVLHRLDEAMKSGEFDEQFRIVRMDGTLRWVAVQGFPILDKSGAIYRLAGVVQDITRQQRVEAALRESEDRYRDLVEHSEDLLCTHDLDGRLLSCNAAPARILGYSMDELLKMPMRNLLAPEFRNEFDEYLKRVQINGRAEGLMVLLARNGEHRIWEYKNTLRTGGPGGPIVRGMAHDVTERRRAEAELQKSEQRFRVALKSAPIMVSTQDQELRYTWIYNPRLAWAKTDCIGKTDEDILQPAEAVQLTELKHKALDTGTANRTLLEFTHGRITYCFDITTEPVINSAGKVIGVTSACLDVTDLRDKATRLHLLLETTASLASRLRLEELLGAISSSIQPLIHHDFASVSVFDVAQSRAQTYPLDLDTARKLDGAEINSSIDLSLVRQFSDHPDVPISWRLADGKGDSFEWIQQLLGPNVQTICCIPLQLENGIASVNLGSVDEQRFDSADLYILRQLATQVSVAFRNAFRYRTIQELTDRLQAQTRYLERTIETEGHFVEFLGSGNTIRGAVNRAHLLAPKTTTVMILGEPGTGRESLARQIHSMGPRSQHRFVKFDCRGNSGMRLDKELLGYNAGESGHTLLQLARQGTLYIHEINDLSIESQKRLIPLFDQLCSQQVISTDGPLNVRFIVSARPDILRKVAEGRFLRELYDRIAVFPISLPALRDHPEDIPEIVNHLVEKYAIRLAKRLKPVSRHAMQFLANREWTGNVRQLESVIEWAVLSASGPSLEDFVPKAKSGFSARKRG